MASGGGARFERGMLRFFATNESERQTMKTTTEKVVPTTGEHLCLLRTPTS